jgi:hypothetical protein
MAEFTEDVVVVEADLRLTDAQDADIVRINSTGRVIIRRGNGGGAVAPVLTFEPGDGELIVGSTDRNGKITLTSQDGEPTIEMQSGNASIDVGVTGTAGDVRVYDLDGTEVVHLDGGNARVIAGALGHAGKLVVQDEFERVQMRMDAGTGVLTVGAEDDSDGVQPGQVVIRGQLGRDAIWLNGANSVVTIGGNGNEGDLVVKDGNGFDAFRVDGASASVYIGGGNVEGDLIVRDLSRGRRCASTANTPPSPSAPRGSRAI